MLIKSDDIITVENLKALVDKCKTRHDEMYKLHLRYKTDKEGTPIKKREYMIDQVKQTGKINNHLNNDFFSEIVDTKIGFFVGVPIVYGVDEKAYGETEKKKIDEYITDFNAINNIADLDSETAKRTAIYGSCGRLMYIEDAIIKAKIYEGYNCIFIGDSIAEPRQSVYYYHDDDAKKTTAYLYDETNVIKCAMKDDEEKFSVIEGATAHGFDICPLFGFANNDELLGDGEKVLELIDAYDRGLSDINNELEQFRLAYLAFIGVKPTEETLEAAKQTGAFYIPLTDGRVEFIMKNLNDAIIEHHLDRIEANIYRFSATPNMKDISFAGNLTGVAMAYKFRPFEYKCKTMELKFKTALSHQYKIMQFILNAKGIPINYMDMDFVFVRNYPQNLLEEAQILTLLKGQVSEKTRYSVMSFIDDPQAEIEAMQEDNLGLLPPGALEDRDGTVTPEMLAIEAESKAQLKGTVGGVQGILQIQQSVSQGITEYSAALAMLMEIYGFNAQVASLILGDPKKIKPQSQGKQFEQQPVQQ